MDVAHLVITALAILANGYAAALSLAGAASVRVVADRVRVSQRWMAPFGCLLAAGALGLAVGLAVPLLGTAAALGLTLYFSCAVGAHVRVRDRGVRGAVFFLALALAALGAGVAAHGLG